MNAQLQKATATMNMPLASTQKEVLHVLVTQVTAVMESAVKVRKRQKIHPKNDFLIVISFSNDCLIISD